MTTTLTARGPEDLLAAVPIVLGFHPHESLVLLTFDAAHPFHARVDLPPSGSGHPPPEEATAELADLLLAPCLTHRVGRVVLLFYAEDPGVVTALAPGLRAAFVGADVGVIDTLLVSRAGWARVRHDGTVDGVQPVADDVHPFTARAVFEGRVTRPSRDDLRDSLTSDPDAVARVVAAGRDLPTPGGAEGPWLRETLTRLVRRRGQPDDATAARMLRAVAEVPLRDAALYAVTRASSPDHLRIWSGLLPRAPDDRVAEVAVLTAFCAWQSGDGALAWCALDRCFAADPQHRLGRCLAECLGRAVPPSAWAEMVTCPDGGSDPA